MTRIRKKRKIITKIVGTMFQLQRPRAAHALCSDQNAVLRICLDLSGVLHCLLNKKIQVDLCRLFRRMVDLLCMWSIPTCVEDFTIDILHRGSFDLLLPVPNKSVSKDLPIRNEFL